MIRLWNGMMERLTSAQTRTRLALVALTIATIGSQGLVAQGRPIGERIQPNATLRVTQEHTIGELDGPLAFGRVVAVATNRSGAVFIVDEANHRISVVDAHGNPITLIGRQGRGPGEFESPAAAAVDATDTLFVWDAALGRLSVFDPKHRYVRSANLPVSWTVNSLKVLPSGELLFAAFSAGEQHGLHVVSREGKLDRSFADVTIPEGVSAFFDSVLGGSAEITRDGIAYLRKSPYELAFYSPDGVLRHACIGRPTWTTPPKDVIEISATREGLRWLRYRHASELALLPNGLVLTVIAELGKPERVVLVVGKDCTIRYRGQWPADQMIAHGTSTHLYAITNEDIPQVIVYRIR